MLYVFRSPVGWLVFCIRHVTFWLEGAYIYHSIGLAATSFISSHSVPSSQYIDDISYVSVRCAFSQARVNYIYKD